MKPPKSRKAELAANATGGEKSHAEAAESAEFKMTELGPNATGGDKSHAETAESAEFKMTELGPIPVDWKVCEIGDIACVCTGNSNTQDKVATGMYPFYVRSPIVERINEYGFDTEGVITVGDGVGTGKVFHYVNGKFALHQRCYLIDRFCSNVDVKYFFKIFSALFYDRVMQMTAKSSVDSVRREMITGMPIPLPPLAEQRRIAGALSDVDELISALGKLIEKKRNIKTGAMQELLTGKTRLPGFKGKWVEKTFCEFISRFATGLNPRQNFKLNSGGNNYYITIKDFKNGKISFNGCDKVDDLALRLINERSDLRAGDLLFSSIGRVGDAYVIKDTPSNWNINESVFSLRPDESQMDVNFLYYLVKSSAVQERLTSGITGSTLTGIKIGELRGIVCFYPNELAEQKAIAAVLSDIDAEIAALEADRAKYKSIKQGMMQELLTGRTRLM